MTATLTFHPLGNADCTRIDFADGKKMLVDYADMRNDDDPYDKRIELPEELRADLRAADRDDYDVVCFTHLDDDHCCGAGDFFWFDHAAKYQGAGRIEIKELWVPAAAILEDGCQDSARIIRQEARHRLRQGYGIRVFSRPKKLREWLEKQGLSLESRAHLITDAGQYVPGFSKFGTERAEFFIHSPFGWRQNETEVVDRNQDSVVFQATFLEGGRETYALFMSDIHADSIDQIVLTTKRHGREDRLLWDIFKVPHHCSYTAIGWIKGEDETEPTAHVEWLCETQGRERHIMVSTSKPMPIKGSAEDDDVQPPHRQAGNYYKSVARNADGQFKVTMETPSVSRPKQVKIEITDRGAQLLTISAAAGAAAIVSTRRGRADRMTALHEWWTGFGQTLPDAVAADIGRARDAAAFIASGAIPGVALVEARQTAGGSHVALQLDIEVERPQDLACDIRAIEPVAVIFDAGGHAPSVLALRADFPDTMHQNAIPSGFPRSLCIDDRPWAEAQLTFTIPDFIRRIQLWLARAAKGELHDPAQPLEPLFFGSALKILVPTAALADQEDPAELIGFAHPDNPNIVVTRLVGKDARADVHPNGFVVVPLRAAPQQTGRLRQSPATLAALAAELAECGVDLGAEIARRVIAWAGLQKDDLRRLSSRLAIIAASPVEGTDGKTADDLRAFVTEATAGEVGAALGVIERNVSDVGSGSGYVRLIGMKDIKSVPVVDIAPAEVHLDFNRDLGAAISGQEAPDTRAAVMIGAGSLGSQVAINLAREGRFRWTLVDNDALLPHNLARHALFSSDVGVPKAIAVARRMHGLLDESIGHLACNVLAPSDQLKEALADKLRAAEIIIDASASVAVSRYVADLPAASGRRLSVFFNPAGTAVVLLSEGTNRDVTLRDLESQYHRIFQIEPALADHLRPRDGGLRYSGSCRAVTNRISASQAALLSAIAARGMTTALKDDGAAIRIWSVSDESEVRLYFRPAAEVTRVTLGDWTVTYDTLVQAELVALRERNLPHETGGVLLGISDTSRHSIHIVRALPQPGDSQGSVTRFERGVSGLREAVAAAAEASLHQVRYVGEWHSHPVGSSTTPSTIDLSQLSWLTEELEDEGIPALMAIAGDHGSITLLLGGRQRAPDGVRKECA